MGALIKIGIRPKDAWQYTPWETNMALTGYFEAENRQTERFAWVIGSMVGKSADEVMGKPKARPKALTKEELAQKRAYYEKIGFIQPKAVL